MIRKKYTCRLCGRARRVFTYPRSKCICRTGFPNKYMKLRWQIIDFFVWGYQAIYIKILGEWK